MGNKGFQILDYVVFILMLLVSASIGIYYRFTGGKQQTTDEYLLANRDMSIWPVGFSLMASFMSAVTLLGVSAENYIYGTQFVLINISYIFGTFIAAYLYLPVFFNLQTTSAYQYLELRFGRLTRLSASLAFVVQMVLYTSIVLYAPALALSAVTGFSKWISILSVGTVCTFYSTIGGMKAVLWTDMFQSFLMFAAIFAIIIKGLIDFSGFSEIWRIADDGHRIEFFNFDPDPTTRHTFWTQVIGGIFTYTSLYGINQAQVQRLLTVKTLRQSQKALFLNWPILTVLSFTTSFSGLVIYAKYHDCDPLLRKRINSPDQLLPLFVIDFLSNKPGLAGLFVSGIFSGALSTVSSAVNSLSAVVLEDFLKPLMSRRNLSEKVLALYSKLLAFGFGLICLGLTYVVSQLGSVLQASLTIFGVVGGPLLGLFSLGMFCHKCNQKGAIFGFIIGLVLCFWLGFGKSLTNPYIPKLPQSVAGCEVRNLTVEVESNSTTLSTTLTGINVSSTPSPADRNEHILYVYRLSYMWLAPIGFITVIVFGLLGSVITGNAEECNLNLLTPHLAKYLRYSKERQRSKYMNVAVIKDDELSNNTNLNGQPSNENHVTFL